MKKITIIAGLFLAMFFTKIPKAFAWTQSKIEDKMDDKSYAHLDQPSEESVFSGKKAKLTIEINCNEDHPLISLKHPWIVGEGAKARFDKEEPFSIIATGIRDNLLIGEKDSDPTISQFIEKMSKHKTLLLRYSDSTHQSIDATFNLAGLSEKLKTACAGKKLKPEGKSKPGVPQKP